MNDRACKYCKHFNQDCEDPRSRCYRCKNNGSDMSDFIPDDKYRIKIVVNRNTIPLYLHHREMMLDYCGKNDISCHTYTSYVLTSNYWTIIYINSRADLHGLKDIDFAIGFQDTELEQHLSGRLSEHGICQYGSNFNELDLIEAIFRLSINAASSRESIINSLYHAARRIHDTRAFRECVEDPISRCYGCKDNGSDMSNFVADDKLHIDVAVGVHHYKHLLEKTNKIKKFCQDNGIKYNFRSLTCLNSDFWTIYFIHDSKSHVVDGLRVDFAIGHDLPCRLSEYGISVSKTSFNELDLIEAIFKQEVSIGSSKASILKSLYDSARRIHDTRAFREIENRNHNLQGSLMGGYTYTEPSNSIVPLILPSFPEIEKFCFENDIKWSIDVDDIGRRYIIRFDKKRDHYRYELTFDAIKTVTSITFLERNIVQLVKKYLNIKENKNMSNIRYDEFLTFNTRFELNCRIPEIKDVIFSGPCTIVKWSDGDKTIVRCGEDDTFDKEKGLAMAIVKKVMGSNKTKSNYCDIFKKWCKEEPKESVRDKVNELKDKLNAAFGIPKYVSVKVYSDMNNISQSKVRKMCREGKLDAVKNSDNIWQISTSGNNDEVKLCADAAHITIAKFAEDHDIPKARVRKMCREGRLDAVKGADGQWKILKASKYTKPLE